MTCTLQVLGTASWSPGEPTWVKWCDVDARDGIGEAELTNDRAEAMEFPDAPAAMAYWRRRSHVRPVRDDGKPNRPLTAFTVSIEEDQT